MSELRFADMVFGSRTTIPRSIEEVWRRVLNLEDWMMDFQMTRMTPQRNCEGEIWRATPLVDPKALSLKEAHAFYFKTLALTPPRKFVYKAYTPHRGGQYSFSGIEILSLSEAGESTRLSIEVFLEFQSDRMSESELSAFAAQGTEGSAGIWQRNFQRIIALFDSA